MCLTLVVSFVLVNQAAEGRIKNRLRETLRTTEAVLSRSEAEYNQRNLKTLSALTQSVALKAGVGLLRETGEPRLKEQVHETLLRQLQDIGDSLDCDLLLLRDSLDNPVVGVIGNKQTRARLEPASVDYISSALIRIDGKLFEATSLPINIGAENLGTLTIGKSFSVAGWNEFGDTALIQNGQVIFSTFAGNRAVDFERELNRNCKSLSGECELSVAGESFLAIPIRKETFKDGVRLVSLQSIDSATRELTQNLKSLFLLIGGGGVLLMLLVSAAGARSIARPLVELMARLRREGSAGGFTAELGANYQAAEVNELALEFTRAAGAVRDSERRLDEATEQFIESMAQAQDARDPYTAGHSERVSGISIAIASAMGLGSERQEIIRIGAKLHDLGKIGVPDALLRKPGKLTREEYVLIQRHPQIGKEILEKVGRFSDFLPIVELHHENPDGSGYPYGLNKNEIPLDVRIVHVADVWDALTSDRAYRAAMSVSKAWELIRNGTGPLFDPEVVEAFWTVLKPECERDNVYGAIVPHEVDHVFYPCLRA
jgi:hypothetical protein